MTALWVLLICAVLSSAPTFVTSSQPSSLQEAKRGAGFIEQQDPSPVLDDIVDRINGLEIKTTVLKEEIDVLRSRRCESGTRHFNPKKQPEKMVGGVRVREQTVHVWFSCPFSTKPWVSVSLSTVDANKNSNLRVHSRVSGVTHSGFDVSVKEWTDSTLYWVQNLLDRL